MSRCEFAGDANTKAGRLIPCPNEGVVKIRIRNDWAAAIHLGKPCVCHEHMTLMLSAEVKAAGRDWQIDHFLREVSNLAPRPR
jgi:hypothetical protein